jgi:hypothetical protein
MVMWLLLLVLLLHVRRFAVDAVRVIALHERWIKVVPGTCRE